MGFSFPSFGNTIEVGGTITGAFTFTTTPVNCDIGLFYVPTVIELPGTILAAYVDFNWNSYVNSDATNKVYNPTGDNKIYAVLVGGAATEHICHSSVSNLLKSDDIGTFVATRTYGDTNVGSDYQLRGSSYYVRLKNARTSAGTITIKNYQPILRLIMAG